MTVRDRVLAKIAHQCGIPPAEVRDGRALGCDISNGEEPLDLDSLDRIELAMQLEDEFSISISDSEVDSPNLGTVAGLVRFIEGKVETKRAFQESVNV
jgi:acyl carrier protein